jgi:hypothetical protein
MSEPSQIAEDIFFAALEQPDAAQRRAFVVQACAGMPELRAEVEKLFALTAAADRFFAEAETELNEVLALASKSDV